MHLKHLPQSLKALGLAAAIAAPAAVGHAAVNYYECADLGYIATTHKTAAGVVATSNKGSEIYLLKDNVLTPMVKSPGAGMYINVSKDGRYVGFKSINNDANQAPAILDVTTGATKLLENYVEQCGQISFADDGTMAYTMGNTLVIRKGDSRRTYDLGLYTNIANISPDASKVSYSSFDGVTYIIDLTSGNITEVANMGSYRSVWSPDNAKLAVQQSNGGLFSLDLRTKTVYPLGEATSVSWSDNSDELFITRSERVNELEVKGASVLKMKYTGADASTIVGLTEATPISVTSSGNELIISYANGDERGVTRTAYNSGIRAGAPAKVTRLLQVGASKRIGEYVPSNFGGHVRPDLSAMSADEFAAYENRMAKASASPLKGNDIGLTAIPYINQVWDTPAVGGSTAYGYVCCAPTSSCMMLGYYGKLSPVAVTSRYTGSACYYSWYVAMQYTSVTGYTFSTSASGGGYWGYTYGVKGGYGYMWGNGSPATMMSSFHTRNGASNSYFESSNAALARECEANRPYVMCLNNGTGGHVVLCFRANQIAYNDGSGTYARTGSFVCHDPYGDYNGSSYPNWDGRYSSYDLPGYSNGRANIGAFYWGCVTVSSGGSTPTPSNPKIDANPSDVKFTCRQGETPSVTVSVSGSDLSSDISVASSHSWRFSVTPATLGKTGGNITIKMEHSELVGTYGQGGTALDGSFYVKLKSGSTEKVINITADVTAPPITGLDERAVVSQKRGNQTSKGYDATKIRNFCYKDGKLYCVYENSRILVLNAQTLDMLGYLAESDLITSSSAKLADVKTLGGHIVASNIAQSSKGEELRIYGWSDDNAKPYLIFNTTDFQGADRLGDCLEMTGDFGADCWFAFGRDNGGVTRIVEYNRKNGIWSSKHTKVYTGDGKQYICGDNMRAYPQGSGWWVDGKNGYPAWTTWDDGMQGTVARVQCLTEYPRGSSHHEFWYKGLKYALNMEFGDSNGADARMRLIQDKVGDFSDCSFIGYYPSDGLGAGGLNPNGTGDCMVNTDGQNYVEAWLLSTGQGLAYFTFGDVPAQNPQPIIPVEEEKQPVLSANPTSLSFAVEPGQNQDKNVTINGTDLRGNISLWIEGAHSSQFSISRTSLNQSGDITVTYHPNGAGTHSATLVASSQDASDVHIALSGTCTEKQTVDYNITADELKEQWISSETAGTKSWHDISGDYSRGIAFKDGKLYVLHCKPWAAPYIVILDAYTGDKKGDLSVDGVTGATIQLGDIISFDGKLIASNVCTATQNFRLYVWDNDNSAPAVIVAKDAVNHICGNAISATGTWQNGRIWVAKENSNSILYFNVKNGTVESDIHEITFKDENGNNFAFGTDGRGSARVIDNGDGTYWITSMHGAPARFREDGTRIESMQIGALKDSRFGTAIAPFAFGDRHYTAAITYTSTANADGGQMALINTTDGMTAASAPITVVPAAGLGNTRNDQRTSNVIMSTRDEGTTIDLWAHVTKQGLAHYSYKGMKSGVNDIVVDADSTDAPVEFFNLQGVRLDGDNLVPGVYIRRQGAKAEKVIVR